MTAIVYDKRTKTIVADTQNTDSSGSIFRVDKIEVLKDGRYFMGSGNYFTICKARRWAEAGFREKDRPDFGALFHDDVEYAFSCLLISKDGSMVTLIDEEMEPIVVTDEYVAIGSGAALCLGALDAGATALRAVEIACDRDGSVSRPIHQVTIGVKKK